MNDTPSTTIRLLWEGDQKFTSLDKYGHTITVDAPLKENEAYTGFKPDGLLLSSLAGCSGIDVIGVLKKQRQDVTGLEIMVKGTQQSNPPWTWDKMHLNYVVRGKGLLKSAVERAIHLSETKYCSIASTLKCQVEITSSIQICEED